MSDFQTNKLLYKRVQPDALPARLPYGAGAGLKRGTNEGAVTERIGQLYGKRPGCLLPEASVHRFAAKQGAVPIQQQGGRE